MLKKREDLTVGTPWKVLLLFAVPIFIGNVIQQIYGLTDAVLVGKVIGFDAFSAIGISGSVTYIATVFVSGFAAGAAAYTAQLYGAQDMKAVRHSYGVSIIINLIAGLILTLVMELLLKQLLLMVNLEEGTVDWQYAEIYSAIIFGGLVAIALYNMYLSFLRAIGDTRTPLYLLIIYSAFNILFDFLFIFVFHWGVVGAASAYVGSITLSTVIAAIWVYVKYPDLRLAKEDFKLDGNFVKEHLKLGLPLGAQFSILGIGVIAMQGAVQQYGGTQASGGYNAACKIENFLCTTINAIGASVAAFSGQNYGAKKYKRVKQGMNQAIIIMVFLSIINIIVTFLMLDVACGLFLSNPDAATVEYCKIYLIWDIVGYFSLSLIYVFRYTLQGIGKPLAPFLGGVGELIGRLLYSLVFTQFWGATAALGASGGGAWIICSLVLLVGAIIEIYRNPKFAKDEETPSLV
jgi:putative MATE family efflux protein